MPPHKKPTFDFDYDVPTEISALRAHKKHRQIPGKGAGRLLLATWNIANFGVQARRDQDHRLLAEILSWFDITAVQEVVDNFAPLEDVVRRLGGSYRMLFSDVAGNNERMAFVYNSRRAKLQQKIGEIAVAPKDQKHIKLKGVQEVFRGFDRNPYLAAFEAGPQNSFVLVNVHLYSGSDGTPKTIGRRSLETYAVARWADLRRKSNYSFTREIVALGDFNMPKRDPSDPIYKALTSRGLELPEHSTALGSNLASDKHYDQIAFFPGKTKNCFRQMGVFDFDKVIFKALWDDPSRTEAQFRSYVRYYISDHRPLWMELSV